MGREFRFHQFASKQSLFTQLVQQLEENITNESVSVSTAKEILDAFCKQSNSASRYSLMVGDDIQREQAVYHECREAFMRANIRHASIMRQVFPAYRQDPAVCKEDDCFELVIGGVFRNPTLKDKQQAFLSAHWKTVCRISQKTGQETLFFSWLTQIWHHEIEQLHGEWASLNNTACCHRLFHKSNPSLKEYREIYNKAYEMFDRFSNFKGKNIVELSQLQLQLCSLISALESSGLFKQMNLNNKKGIKNFVYNLTNI